MLTTLRGHVRSNSRGQRAIKAVVRAFLSLETTFATPVCLRWLRLALLHAHRDRSSPSDRPGRQYDLEWRHARAVLELRRRSPTHPAQRRDIELHTDCMLSGTRWRGDLEADRRAPPSPIRLMLTWSCAPHCCM